MNTPENSFISTTPTEITTGELTANFASKLAEFCERINKAGVSQKHLLSPYSEASILRFQEKSEKQKLKIIQDFTLFSQHFSDFEASDLQFNSEAPILRRVLKTLGIMVEDSCYQTLQQGDIIEIYNTDFKQIFRNLEFMYVCSYTLMDLVVHEPIELYERSQQINEYILEAAGRLLSRGYDPSPISLEHIPKHLIREKFSEDKLTSFVELKKAYPLYAWPRQIYGWLVVQKGEPVIESPRVLDFI